MIHNNQMKVVIVHDKFSVNGLDKGATILALEFIFSS